MSRAIIDYKKKHHNNHHLNHNHKQNQNNYHHNTYINHKIYQMFQDLNLLIFGLYHTNKDHHLLYLGHHLIYLLQYQE